MQTFGLPVIKTNGLDPCQTANCESWVSANARDFMTLHTSWIQQGRAHSGILILPQQRYTTRELIRRCLRVSTAGSLENGIHFLSNF